MKILAAVFLLLSSVAMASETYICSTGPHMTPHDTFRVTFENGKGGIQYERHAFFGPEEMSVLLDVPYCTDRQTIIRTRTEIYLECGADGDSGYLTIDLTQRPTRGKLVFPEGNIGYVEDTELNMICLRTF